MISKYKTLWNLRPYNRSIWKNNSMLKYRNISSSEAKVKKDTTSRYNKFGIQMLPEKLHKQIFKETRIKDENPKQIQQSIEHLDKFGLWGKEQESLPDYDVTLPKLYGNNVNEHFENVASEQSRPYREALNKLVKNELPNMPGLDDWVDQPGWTRYTYFNGKLMTEPVEYPAGDAVVFDCEVLVSASEAPIMAVAASTDAWFSWSSSCLKQEDPRMEANLESMIPIESAVHVKENCTECKLVIGHNVGYDRARIQEQYYSQLTNVRFLDTMSMHIGVSGFNFQQRVLSQATRSEVGENFVSGSSAFDNDWVSMGTTNALKEVHKFYCGKTLDKELRDVFVTGNIKDVRENFQELMWYCAKDVQATYNVLAKLTPLFFDRFPHPVTFAGMLEMGQMYLPVNNNWFRYIRSCQDQYNSLNLELEKHLTGLASDACHYAVNEKYKTDKWLCDLDWTTRPYKLLTKPRKGWVAKEKPDLKVKSYLLPLDYNTEELKFLGKSIRKERKKLDLIEKLNETANRLPLVKPHMPGAPKWYSELCVPEKDQNWKPGATLLSTLTRVTPRLLRLMWQGCPLYHVKDYGWGYLCPDQTAPPVEKKVEDEDLLKEVDQESWNKQEVQSNHTPAENIEGLPDGYTFHRLPHAEGAGKNVGSPLSRDFISHVESGLLSSYNPLDALRCLEINKITSYWRSSQKRVLNQIVVEVANDKRRDCNNTPNEFNNKDMAYSAIVPQAIVCGAVSRRAVERVWLTASNPQLDRIGSELKAMVQAPPGFCFVGADVDSQELWIASLLGDASSAKEHGCTALSWMTLRGNKKEGTDLHSTTAASIGISRDQAKVFNYGRMYGAGKKSSLRSLMQFNKDLSREECIAKVNKLYGITKGEVQYKLSRDALWIIQKTGIELNSEAMTSGYASFDDVTLIQNVANEASNYTARINRNDLVCGRRWHGGIESHMFNKVEEISNSKTPKTPALDCKISRALEPGKVNGNFVTTRMNWVVQSSAVDYLHLLLVSMRWLIEKYKLDCRFVLSIHDEVRYMSSYEHRHKTALALQISNLLTRSMFAYKLGMDDLPLGVAFFSCIEVDSVVRKSADDDCVTPSNSEGLSARYGIPLGESYDVNEILKATNNGQFH
nr:DNA polymerase subunit gamma-1-like [Ciona intestinalis]|eukprot:XP_002125927.3 DNA polymerase subunit gamma-1-like [Ciona intestinalis]